LGGFYGAADCLANEAGNFDAALFNVENDGPAGRQFRFG